MTLLKTLRGATTVSANTTTAIQLGVSELLQSVLNANETLGLTTQAMTGVWFTVTPDITVENPARVARTQLGWEQVPMMCCVEPAIEGFPPLCVRVMIQWQVLDSTAAQFEQLPRFVYLHGAALLRQ